MMDAAAIYDRVRELADEDPPCDCVYVSEDITDASACPVHGKPTPEPDVTPRKEVDADVQF